MAETKHFTTAEVKSQSGKGKTMVILHDKVYDVTAFLNEHPGGEEVLLEQAGKDASEAFDDIGHSNDAFELMTQYHVGDIVDEEKTNRKPKKGWTASYNAKQPEKNVKGPGTPGLLLLAGIVAVVAFAYYLFY